MENLIHSYIDWLKKGLITRKLDNDWHEIVTPFLNHKNDLIELYVKKGKNDSIIISDGGNTLNELYLSGLNINNSKKRQKELHSITLSFGITLNEDLSLSVLTNLKQFPAVKHRLIQAMISIDDLYVLSTPKVKSYFLEDVSKFFDLNEIIYIKDAFFTGKSGFTHKFDFTLPKIGKRKEIAVKAISLPRKDTIGSVLWMIEDTKKAREQTNGLVILNDTDGVAADITDALQKYDVPFFNWSGRENSLQQLKIA